MAIPGLASNRNPKVIAKSPVYLHCLILVQHCWKKRFFFQVAFDIARCTRDAFQQKALPKFFQYAPTVGINENLSDNPLEVNY